MALEVYSLRGFVQQRYFEEENQRLIKLVLISYTLNRNRLDEYVNYIYFLTFSVIFEM